MGIKVGTPCWGDASLCLPAVWVGCSAVTPQEWPASSRGVTGVLPGCDRCPPGTGQPARWHRRGSAVPWHGSGFQGDYLLPQSLNSEVIPCLRTARRVRPCLPVLRRDGSAARDAFLSLIDKVFWSDKADLGCHMFK